MDFTAHDDDHGDGKHTSFIYVSEDNKAMQTFFFMDPHDGCKAALSLYFLILHVTHIHI